MSFFGLTAYGAQNFYSFYGSDVDPAQITQKLEGSAPRTLSTTSGPAAPPGSPTRSRGLEESAPVPGADVGRMPFETVTPPEARQFSSLDDFKYRMRKHMRSQNGPHQKFRTPLTNNHEYGWFAHDAHQRRDAPMYQRPYYGLKSSAETLHAGELVKWD